MMPFDCEDIAIGPGPTPGVDYVFWGDIGDNNNGTPRFGPLRAPHVRTPVPGADGDTGERNDSRRPISIRLSWSSPVGADAPSDKDAETLLVDPLNGDIYVITKRTELGTGLSGGVSHNRRRRRSRWSSWPSFPGASWVVLAAPRVGTCHQTAVMVIVRRYTWYDPQATIWLRPPGAELWEVFGIEAGCDVSLILEDKGEAVCFRSATGWAITR